MSFSLPASGKSLQKRYFKTSINFCFYFTYLERVTNMRLKADRRKPMHSIKFGRNTLYLSKNDPRRKIKEWNISKTVLPHGKRLPKLTNSPCVKYARIRVFSGSYFPLSQNFPES